MDVCCCPSRHGYTSGVSILYGYMYVAPQDEACRYSYDLCRELLLFSLRAIWYMCTLEYVYCNCPNKHEVNITCLWSIQQLVYSLVGFLYWTLLLFFCIGT